MFSSKSLIVSSLAFRSLIHFKFIFVSGVSALISFFYMQLSSCPSTTYQRECLFSITYSCLLCHRLVDHKLVGVFLGFLYCFTDIYFWVCFFFLVFLFNNFFHYSWFTVFCQFSTAQRGDLVTHISILFSHIIMLHHKGPDIVPSATQQESSLYFQKSYHSTIHVIHI